MARWLVLSAGLSLVVGSAGCTIHTHSGPAPDEEATSGGDEAAEAETGSEADEGRPPEVAARRVEQEGDGSADNPIVVTRKPTFAVQQAPTVDPSQVGGSAGEGDSGADDGDDDSDADDGDDTDTDTGDSDADDGGDTDTDDDDGDGSDTGDSDADDGDAAGSGPAEVTVACSFDDGWVSVLPEAGYDPEKEFLMQALIGLTTDAEFWRGESSFAPYEPYRATKCKADGTHFEMEAGTYYVLVGWAGRFDVEGEYKNNGFVQKITVEPGGDRAFELAPADMTHTWVCISCPYLSVYQGGELADLGQVLVDRYTRRRRGTDVVRARADVRDGQLRLVVSEREPEVTHLDAVTVTLDGTQLQPAAGTPSALSSADGDTVELSMGESTELVFEAPGVADGTRDVEIRVTGHYEPVGPTL